MRGKEKVSLVLDQGHFQLKERIISKKIWIMLNRQSKMLFLLQWQWAEAKEGWVFTIHKVFKTIHKLNKISLEGSLKVAMKIMLNWWPISTQVRWEWSKTLFMQALKTNFDFNPQSEPWYNTAEKKRWNLVITWYLWMKLIMPKDYPKWIPLIVKVCSKNLYQWLPHIPDLS